MSNIEFAIPNKGRLHQPAINVLDRAGLKIIDMAERQLSARTIDPEIEILYLRAADIPEFVQDGVADLGITGYDLILESGVAVEVLLDLGFGQATLVVAAPETSSIQKTQDISSGTKVATEFPSLTKRFFEEKRIDVEIVKVSGATEISPRIGVADVIVDLASTGTSLRMNRLKVVDEIMETSARLIVNKDSLKKKRTKIGEIVTAFRSVLEAEGKLYVMMNVPREAVDKIKKIMPGMAGPTVMEVEAETPTVVVHAVVEEKEVFKAINKAKSIGAKDILVVPIERIVR